MSGVTYDDPKLRNLIRTDVYEKANEHAKKMFIGNDNDIKNYNKEFPQIPLYETTLGYSVRPTQNYPDDIYDWHEKVFSDENLAKKYLKGHPYSLGELTPEGRANFESEIKINKVVAVSPNAYPGITDNVRHDIVQLDSDIRDYRIRALLNNSTKLILNDKWIRQTSEGDYAFNNDVPNNDRRYYNSLGDLTIMNASISGIGGNERYLRAQALNNDNYETYSKLINLEGDQNVENIPAEQISGDVPEPGEEIESALLSGELSGGEKIETEAETDENTEVIIIQEPVEGPDGDSFNEGAEGNVVDSETNNASASAITQNNTEQEVDPVASEEFARWRNYPAGTPKPNMLHYFASYSTHFDLYMMNPSDFNEIQDTLITSGYDESLYFNFDKKPERLLMSTSGKRLNNTRDSSNNNRFFTRDYHIDDVRIESYISPSRQNAGAKFTNISMTIFEPYGATLIENLVKACVTDPINGERYTDVPYMLRIKFNGYDANGVPINTRVPAAGSEGNTVTQNMDEGVKYLICKISNVNFKVTPEGTEYNFEFYNYNSFAFENYIGVLESNIQVNSGTLGAFFGLTNVGGTTGRDVHIEDMSDGSVTEFTTNTRDVSTTRLDDGTDIYVDRVMREANPGAYRERYVVNSKNAKNFPEILNSIQAKKTKYDDRGSRGQETADTFEFKLDVGALGSDKIDNFYNHKIVKPEAYDVHNIPVYADRVQAVYAGTNAFQSYVPIEGTDSAFQLPAGTSIIDVIRAVIQTSTFMTSQVTATTETRHVGPPGTYGIPSATEERTTYSFTNTPEKPLMLYKVTPMIKIGKWDTLRKTYRKHVIYIISLYTAEGEIQEAMGKYAVTDVVKQYDYLYTGNNKDVIEFDLTFNAGGFETREIGKFADSGIQEIVSTDRQVANSQSEGVGVNAYARAVKNISIDQSKGQNGKASDFPTIIARNLMSRIYQRGADRIQGELSIMGDPAFIVQDEGFGLQAHTSHYSQNGSVNTHKDPIILLNFYTPPDIEGNPNSPNAGTIRWTDNDGGNSTSVFSGYYKVLTITTEITGNEFTQTLLLARIADQEYDKPDLYKQMNESLTKVPGQKTFVRTLDVKQDSAKSSSTSNRGAQFN